MTLPPQYESAEGLRTLANYLRSPNGVKVRSGIEHEKRVDFFKGKRLIECILEAKKWPKSLPVITDKGVARMVASALIHAGFFHRSEKIEEKKGHLRISQRNVFEENGYFTWMYSGNMMWSNVLTGLVIAAVIICTLMPIWPTAAKQVLWYCSVTFLIFVFVMCMARLLTFMFFWLFGYEFWIFPRLFDETLSFQDSFVPVYTFDKGTAGQGFYRLGFLLALGAFGYWAATQPTEFDGFIQAQKDFIDDLYSGNLLADAPHISSPQQHMQRGNKNVPTLEDLLKAMEADEKEKIGDGENSGVELREEAREENQSADAEINADGEYVDVTTLVDPPHEDSKEDSAGEVEETADSAEDADAQDNAAANGDAEPAAEAEPTTAEEEVDYSEEVDE